MANAETLQREEAEADRADNSMESLLWKLVEFLTHVLQQTWTFTMHGHATEQAQSSGHATERARSQAHNMIEEECEDIVFEEVVTWSQTLDKQTLYTEPALLLHKKMWDIMCAIKKA